MEPRLNVITLAVEDLERALRFYRDGLGFQSPGVIGSEWTDQKTGANGAIALFELEGGLLLSLYPRSDLAKDAEIPLRGAQSGEFSLGQLVQSRTDVDELLGKAEAAGASITPPHGRPWGSIPATSVISTAISGRSSGTPAEPRPRQRPPDREGATADVSWGHSWTLAQWSSEAVELPDLP